MSPEQLLALATARGVALDAVCRGAAPEWTMQDAAYACEGMPRVQFLAAMYAWAGDDQAWSALKTALLEYLLAERERNQWAQKVERISGERTRFAEELVELLLADERRPAVFQASPDMRARCLSVEPETWRRVVSHQYAAIQSEFGRWLLDAADHIRRKIGRG